MKQRNPSQLVLREKEVREDGSILELVVWQLEHAVPGSPHGFKYRLYFGRDGHTLVRYDNERGKGDHRHVDGRELPYGFKTLEALIEDFFADVEGNT